MPHEGNLLQAAVVFLCAAVLIVPLAKRLQLGAVLGYLLAGVLIGPSVLGLVGNPQSVSHISELGVVLLLFIIGLIDGNLPVRIIVIHGRDCNKRPERSLQGFRKCSVLEFSWSLVIRFSAAPGT